MFLRHLPQRFNGFTLPNFQDVLSEKIMRLRSANRQGDSGQFLELKCRRLVQLDVVTSRLPPKSKLIGGSGDALSPR
jgi:hypothetical protein